MYFFHLITLLGGVGVYHMRSFQITGHILFSYEVWIFQYIKVAVDTETKTLDLWTSLRSAISGLGTAFAENRSSKPGNSF